MYQNIQGSFIHNCVKLGIQMEQRNGFFNLWYEILHNNEKVLKHSTIWMNLTDIALRGRSQVQKRASCT